MKKQDLDNLVGLSVENAAQFCKEKGINLDFYPAEAKPTAYLKDNFVRFWHDHGIVVGWAPGNPWNVEK